MLFLNSNKNAGTAQEIKVGRVSGNTPFSLLILKNNKKPALNSEIFARILFSRIALKEIFATLSNRD